MIAILQDLSKNCFMSKLDVKATIPNILVHPSDWDLLWMKWKGLYFFDMVLPFGLRSAPFLFAQFSSALELIIQRKLHIPRFFTFSMVFSSQQPQPGHTVNSPLPCPPPVH